MPDLNDEHQSGEAANRDGATGDGSKGDGATVERVGSRSSRRGRRREASSYDPRSDRRALRGAARRRKLRARLWLVTAPAVVVIAVVVTLLVVFGGQKTHEGVVASSTTTVPGPAPKGALLLVEQGRDTSLLVLLQSRASGGVVLAIPGITLLKAGDVLQPVSVTAASGQKDVLTAALGEAFGAQVDAVASVAWSDLRTALSGAGAGELPPLTLTSSEDEAAQVAGAVVALLRGTGGASRWAELPLSGDSSGFRAATAAFAVAGGEWIPSVVTGTVVNSGGAPYLDPKADAIRALLTTTSGAEVVTVEVKNGSGVLGVAEQAVAQLQPLGYAVSADGNSDDFPNVEQTRIEVFTGETEAGTRVRALLGVGAVTESGTVEPGHMVVVLGKDYNPSSSSSTGANTAGALGSRG